MRHLERIRRFGVPKPLNEVGRFVATEADAARKRAGIVVPEASGAGLASRRAGRATTQARIEAREVVSLESSGSFGYDCGLRLVKWEIPDKGRSRA